MKFCSNLITLFFLSWEDPSHPSLLLLLQPCLDQAVHEPPSSLPVLQGQIKMERLFIADGKALSRIRSPNWLPGTEDDLRKTEVICKTET